MLQLRTRNSCMKLGVNLEAKHSGESEVTRVTWRPSTPVDWYDGMLVSGGQVLRVV